MRSETRHAVELVAPTETLWPWNGAIPASLGADGNIGAVMLWSEVVRITALWQYCDIASGNNVQGTIYDLASQAVLAQTTSVASAPGWLRLPFTDPYTPPLDVSLVISAYQPAANSAFQLNYWVAGGASPDGAVAVPANGGRFINNANFPVNATNDGFGTDVEYLIGGLLGAYFPPQSYDRWLYDIATYTDGFATAKAYLDVVDDSSLILQGRSGVTTDTLKPIVSEHWPAQRGLYVTWDAGFTARATIRYDVIPPQRVRLK